jgi:hypothetical protein
MAKMGADSPVLSLGRRLIGMTRRYFAISWTMRDLPIPEDCTMGII